MGAFTTTNLDQQLQDRAVTALILAGISTSGAVLSTVREAMDRDYQLIVLNDASSDPDTDTHTFLTSKLFPRHTTVINVDDLHTLWT
jgi:nicotinamidase-related amidase